MYGVVLTFLNISVMSAFTLITSAFLIIIANCKILHQYTKGNLQNHGICKSETCTTIDCFYQTYKDCVVVIGNLQVGPMEITSSKDFINVTLPNLREVTGFVVVYRVKSLKSLGQLFPNLARIRGKQLLNNYGLIIHDMSSLREIGLYGLLKIDRGGAIVWGTPHACFVDTVNWTAIAPKSRFVMNLQDRCNSKCNGICIGNKTVNHCWNNEMCQIYLEGEASIKCHEQCLGCNKNNSTQCTLCRNYTFNGTCVSQCPPETVLLPDCQYCITSKDCEKLEGWVWNKTCVFTCPVDYLKRNTSRGMTCRPCFDCYKTCGDLYIRSLSGIQATESCVFINGSLTIHMGFVPETMTELRTYLSRIQEVRDYIFIHNSMKIFSLDFLSSLRRIRGLKLIKRKYSLIVHDMTNLHDLFTKNVSKNLVVDNGSLKIYNNPLLCMSHIEAILPLFKVPPDMIDLPPGNGYGGSCKELNVEYQIRLVNETSALVMLSTVADPEAHYSVLYARLPSASHQINVPETCSDLEWYTVNANTSFGNQFRVLELSSLRPASNYVICIETFDPILRRLSRTSVETFSTPTGIPKPPFIRKLNASKSFGAVDIHWVDHKDYLPYLTHYELDVSLIDIPDKDIFVKDQCQHLEVVKTDIYHHVLVMSPPSGYPKCCESSSITEKIIEEHFDVCSIIDCHTEEDKVLKNSLYKNFVKTLVLNISSPQNLFKVRSLAPFRDYRFRLRSCSHSRCSRSARGVVRTWPLKNADIPSIINVEAKEEGNIRVKWNPPELTNGPILSYLVEVRPNDDQETLSEIIPQSWCVLPNYTTMSVKTIKANTYLVRVCTRSMAFDRVCSVWSTVESPKEYRFTWLWMGVICGLFLYAISILLGRLLKKRKVAEDAVPIVDLTSTLRNESEPPSKVLTDCAPVYNIPLRDTPLE